MHMPAILLRKTAYGGVAFQSTDIVSGKPKLLLGEEKLIEVISASRSLHGFEEVASQVAKDMKGLQFTTYFSDRDIRRFSHGIWSSYAAGTRFTFKRHVIEKLFEAGHNESARILLDSGAPLDRSPFKLFGFSPGTFVEIGK